MEPLAPKTAVVREWEAAVRGDPAAPSTHIDLRRETVWRAHSCCPFSVSNAPLDRSVGQAVAPGMLSRLPWSVLCSVDIEPMHVDRTSLSTDTVVYATTDGCGARRIVGAFALCVQVSDCVTRRAQSVASSMLFLQEENNYEFSNAIPLFTKVSCSRLILQIREVLD